MISKKELLKDLQNDFCFEEDIAIKMSEFYKTLNWRDVLDKQHHEALDVGLTTLKEDSLKHANMLKDIIRYIEEVKKDEF